MIAVLLALGGSVPVVYGSSIQLKSVYTKNRLGVTTETAASSRQDPVIFSSRPPYDDGWLWTVEPDEENSSLARTAVACGSIIAFSNPFSGAYLSTKKTESGFEVVPATANTDTSSQWTVQCESGDIWEDSTEILIVNLRNKCMLRTGFEKFQNKFAVNCTTELDKGAVWKSAEGIYFPVHSAERPKSSLTDEEL